MKTTGIVTELSDNKAKVMCQRHEACEFCENKYTCSESKCENVVCTVLNNIGAKKGDTVEIETDTGKILKLSFLVFTLPVIICIAVYFSASFLFGGIVLAVITLVALCLSMGIIAFLLNKKVKGKEAGEITRIIR